MAQYTDDEVYDAMRAEVGDLLESIDRHVASVEQEVWRLERIVEAAVALSNPQRPAPAPLAPPLRADGWGLP